ncbi:kinesin-like protein kifc3-like [Plasmopara halstedii]|uniref:Kinesin-like protein kifc3-like n=1 Tax=Plasmopara halstedii TaxID=4781 RepID=A0A0P1A8V9_PLAHL|nr:kinesin-like protein kifc3-like [Plasmopara halstedii]CEG37144.1 kinesin-like protein kifc3-like [Plasmopara halstedii]|eukprot:XP_024573513.1 kinesin-like protein kifc3-like [Plasmopara halstedii]
MESGSEDEESIVCLREEIRKKTQELKQMQDEFDEYTQSSHELELELEQELSRVEKRNVHLLTKNQNLERDLQLTRGKLEEALDQTRQFENELQVTRLELDTAVQALRKLEQQQDDLETQVRVLQATESDLRHKMEREIEEKVFLLSDQEELQREHELAAERFRTEIMDLKSELYALQQKFEDATATSETFSGNDSMATTRSPSEDDDDGYDSSYNANSLHQLTVHERDEIGREVLIESLREEIKALSTSFQDELEARTAAEAELRQLRDSLAHMEAMEAEITEMTDELIGKSQDIRSRDEQIEDLREALLKLQSELVTANDGSIEFTDEREATQRQLDDKEKEIINLRDELDVLKSQCDDLAENECQLKEQLEHETEAAEEWKDQVETLKRKMDKSKQERIDLEKKVQFDESEMTQHRQEVQKLHSMNLDLQKQLNELKKRSQEIELSSALSTAPIVAPLIEKEVAESKRLIIEIKTLRTSLNSLSAENARLRNQEGMPSSVVPAKRVSADVLQLNFTPEQLARKYLAERTRNASLLSRLQTVCGNIQVYCRVRPIINEELDKSWGSKLAVNVVNQSDLAALDIRQERSFSTDSDGTTVSNENTETLTSNSTWKVFTFDRILGPEETQNDVFREVEPIAQSVVDGFKACIFAYGQTGSGKTYTMEGTSSDPGLNYRIISHLFQSIHLRGAIYTPEAANNQVKDDDEMNGLQGTVDSLMYHIQVGVLEIYNDSLRDLINTNNSKGLEIRHDSSTGDIHVPDLTMATVSSPQQTIDVLRNAQSNRITGKTNSNMHSSRSHSIVILQISKRRPESSYPDQDPAEVGVEEEGCGKLYLVDLAGSERVKKSNVSGEMLKEAAHINKSLSALADVMEALDKKMAHVPYRNSKLTYLLQDVLNSSCKTVMIVNVGPTIENASETYRSLQLAERVRNIVVGRNQIVKNKKDILSAKKAFAELQSLKQQMQISKRKYMQSQQSVVALKRDQKNQSEKQSATLQNRLKSWETQNESLKAQNDSLKKLVDDLSIQLKAERDIKSKEAEQRETAQRLLRQQNAKTRVSSSQQEALQELLKERDEDIKRLRMQLTEARRRSTSSLIPRLPVSSPPMKKSKNARPSSSPGSNQQDGESVGGTSRSSKARTVVRRSSGSRLQLNITSSNDTGTDQSGSISKRGSSQGSARLPTLMRATSSSKSGAWK